jgi:outer membrane protein
LIYFRIAPVPGLLITTDFKKKDKKMKRMESVLAVGILSFFFLTGASSPAHVIKIGMIDLQKILELSEAGKAAQMEINIKGKQMETDLKDKGTEIEAIEKEINLESLVMNQKDWEEKQRNKRIKIGDFKALRQKYLNDYKAAESRITGRIQNEVVALLEDIGKKGGYAMIVEKRAGGVVYAPSSMDITDSVIRSYNIKFQNSKSKKTFDTVSPDLYRMYNIQAKLTFPDPARRTGF